MKKCSSCKKIKPKSKFAKDKYRPDGLTCQCKECIRVCKRKYRKTEKGKIAEKRYQQSEKGKLSSKFRTIKYKYGITKEEYKQMYTDQNGKCLLCGKQVAYTKIVVDHDHRTGKVRGLLCRCCNTHLGWFENRKDKINDYLQ